MGISLGIAPCYCGMVVWEGHSMLTGTKGWRGEGTARAQPKKKPATSCWEKGEAERGGN